MLSLRSEVNRLEPLVQSNVLRGNVKAFDTEHQNVALKAAQAAKARTYCDACKPGETARDSGGCADFCSEAGHCGTSAAYQHVDCRNQRPPVTPPMPPADCTGANAPPGGAGGAGCEERIAKETCTNPRRSGNLHCTDPSGKVVDTEDSRRCALRTRTRNPHACTCQCSTPPKKEGHVCIVTHATVYLLSPCTVCSSRVGARVDCAPDQTMQLLNLLCQMHFIHTRKCFKSFLHPHPI